MQISHVDPAAVRRHDPFVRAVLDRLGGLIGDGGGSALATVGYLAGGIAVRCYAGSRTTDDIDMFFRGARLLVPPNTAVLASVEGRQYSLTFDSQYTPDFGLLHPDFEGRAVSLTEFGDRLRLSVLHPADLALTKVARFQDHDQADIAALARTGCFDGAALLRLGEEALAYMVGNLAFARANLRDAAALVDEARLQVGSERP